MVIVNLKEAALTTRLSGGVEMHNTSDKVNEVTL